MPEGASIPEKEGIDEAWRIFFDLLEQPGQAWTARTFYAHAPALARLLGQPAHAGFASLSGAARARLGFFTILFGPELADKPGWLAHAAPYSGDKSVCFFASERGIAGVTNRFDDLAMMFGLAKGTDLEALRRAIRGEAL